jgi:tetratricopeptide (TPR) repeat protein
MTETEEQFRHLMDQGHSAAWDQLWDRAAGFYRQALELMPDNPQVLNSLALALFELQDYKQSLSYYLKSARVAPQDALPFEKLSQLFERLGNSEQAVQAALQAAELYLKNREVNKAMDNWQRVAQLNPDNLRAHSMLALINERLGQKPEAVTEHLALASLYQRQNDPVKAFEEISHALQILPANLEARQAMALLKESRPLPKPVRAGGSQTAPQKPQVPQLAPPEPASEEKEKNPIEEARQRAMSMLAGMLFEGTEEEQNEQSSRRGLNAMLSGVAGLVTRQADRTLILLHLGQAVDMQIQGQKQQAAEELERAVEAGLKHSAVFYGDRSIKNWVVRKMPRLNISKRCGWPTLPWCAQNRLRIYASFMIL